MALREEYEVTVDIHDGDEVDSINYLLRPGYKFGLLKNDLSNLLEVHSENIDMYIDGQLLEDSDSFNPRSTHHIVAHIKGETSEPSPRIYFQPSLAVREQLLYDQDIAWLHVTIIHPNGISKPILYVEKYEPLSYISEYLLDKYDGDKIKFVLGGEVIDPEMSYNYYNLEKWNNIHIVITQTR